MATVYQISSYRAPISAIGSGCEDDLTTAIYDAGYAAGMNFPFPQRKVRLLSDGNTESGFRS